jgi:predicted transglutaminase-like cysteine proteinase
LSERERGRFLDGGFEVSVWAVLITCLATMPSFAAQTLATVSSPNSNHGYTQQSDLFGAREIYSSNLSEIPQWKDMLVRRAAEINEAQHVCTSPGDRDCIPEEWESLVEQIRGRDLREQIEIANDAMNQHPYIRTVKNWHRAMYWETPFQFLRYGGQCQDYAIAKYELLRAAGVPADLMRMVVLHDDISGIDHAVLIVYVDRQTLILDNQRPDIVPTRAVPYYHPYYSINENGWWKHFGGQAMAWMN